MLYILIKHFFVVSSLLFLVAASNRFESFDTRVVIISMRHTWRKSAETESMRQCNGTRRGSRRKRTSVTFPYFPNIKDVKTSRTDAFVTGDRVTPCSSPPRKGGTASPDRSLLISVPHLNDNLFSRKDKQGLYVLYPRRVCKFAIVSLRKFGKRRVEELFYSSSRFAIFRTRSCLI